MGKQNYRDAIEKDRQEVSVLGNAAASRIAQRKAVKEKPKKTKSALLTTLFFLFILIPVSILIYVAFFYEPNDTLTANPSSDEVSLESPIPDAPLVPVVTEEEDSEESAEAEEAKASEAKEEAEAKEAAEKEAADKLAQQEAEKTAAAKEQAQKEQAQKEAAQAEAEKERQRAEAERQKEQAAAEQKKQETPAAPVAASKTHTVQSGETLYRIAVNTYGSAGASAGVEKIKAANGLNSNEITVGSTLVLP
jgi:colicin import membrane protein